MATVRAVVLRRASDSDFLVRPSVVFLEAGDVFRLLNETSYAVSIIASPDRDSGPRKRLETLLWLKDLREVEGLKRRRLSRTIKAGEVHEVSVPVPTAPRNAHNMRCRYQVLVNTPDGQVAAAGDSDPVIIIDNP